MSGCLPRLTLGIQQSWATPVAVPTWKRWFQTWLGAMQIRDPCEVSLLLTDDAQVRRLNACYRGQDCATDVLAFAAEESPVPRAGQGRLLGDIVIAVPTADRQAQQWGHSLTAELAWLASHGLLHLLGWDHPTPEALGAMLQQQQVLLDQVQLAVAPGCLEVSRFWDQE
ncbi:MAG: rRNA maturation RNase YbeY [Thermostichales cyanobacterium BF4_bins_65]